MTSEEIADLARAAGAAGRSWESFTCDGSVEDYVRSHSDSDAAVEAWRAAFDVGTVEHRIASGWVTRWTTAPIGYDSFGTVGTTDGDWQGRPLRKVLIPPHHLGFHESRYHSGLHGCWNDDPRIEAQAIAEREAAWRADDERRQATRAAGMEWLAALTEADLTAVDYDIAKAHGLQIGDVRDERRSRLERRQEAARVETWDRCRAVVRDGMILVDDGTPATRGTYGVVPGRDAHVYYNVRLTNDWEKVADRAMVTAETGEWAGSLESVAEMLGSGRLRAVTSEDVPPAPVTKRIGHEHWKEIRRVTVGDRIVWVGRPRFAVESLVLDENGHLVRSKAIRVLALDLAGPM